MDSILDYLDRLVGYDYFDYVVGGALVLAWWVVSKTRYTMRRLRGDSPLPEEEERISEERPRRRIPLS